MKKILLLVLTLTLAFTGAAQANFVLSGNVLDVGVSNSGGLIDDNFNAGIIFKATGADFLRPGSPFEFFSIGESGAVLTSGYALGNPIPLTSSNTTVLPTLSAVSFNGAFALGGSTLIYTQNVFFDVNASAINFSVDILNAGTAATSGLVYARGLDPDQDVFVGGGFSTINTVLADRVRAFGPVSNLAIEIVDLTGGGVPTVDAFWNTNPYALLVPHNDGNGDYAINMAWEIPSLLPGNSYEIDFQYNSRCSHPRFPADAG